MLNVSLSAYRLLGDPRLVVAARGGSGGSLYIQDSVDQFDRGNDVTIHMPGVDLELLIKACAAFNEVIKNGVV